ncbi:uncharacterized protein LOC103316721 [Nasonia vitripennis]|uniref:Uncharacterized protein n=1 Tax=Nasonia vitripennis TaxID=7425 RepID=A0A7M7Q2Y6_NASVI|nr:uncharacterized protein LOC103316721 [Nasonia vitripennis]XP_031781048.1 uncharacterized protein LOC103316721 [Nasonia vitripennis]
MANFMATVDKKLRSELSQIHNHASILVEFVNNDNSFAVGFTAWLEKDDAARKDYIILLEEEVTIFWPTCDTQSAALLKPKLRKVNFVKHVVKVLAYGEWTDVKEQMKNKVKYDKLNVSLNSRKIIKKKEFHGEKQNDTLPPKKKKRKNSKVEQIQNEALLHSINQEDTVTLDSSNNVNCDKHYSEKAMQKNKNASLKRKHVAKLDYDDVYNSNDSDGEVPNNSQSVKSKDSNLSTSDPKKKSKNAHDKENPYDKKHDHFNLSYSDDIEIVNKDRENRATTPLHELNKSKDLLLSDDGDGQFNDDEDDRKNKIPTTKAKKKDRRNV